MTEPGRTSRIGIRFCEWLALLFIALKLTGHIDWSWWLVLAPLWVGPAVVILFVLVLVTLAGIGSLAQRLIKVIDSYGKRAEVIDNRPSVRNQKWRS